MIERYSKPSGPLLSLKQNFFDENDALLEKGQEINRIYIQQPKRDRCKNCDNRLEDGNFSKQEITYSFCLKCGHLNGLHQDTVDFCSFVYTNAGGASYSDNYSSKNKIAYLQRVKDIYMPKATFLRDSLSELGESPNFLTYSDFGAGAGYFVSALTNISIRNVAGYEVSDSQVNLGNSMMQQELLNRHSLDETVNLAASVHSDIVSMIGVLEHLQNPREILDALKNNKNVRFLYISVPMFSPCVFFEMVFPVVMQRHLSSGHTHLYTEGSLQWLAKEFDMQQVAAWWFGTDMVDLFRCITVQLNKQVETKKMVADWTKMFAPLIDVMQAEIDKKHLSSEVHMLFKFID